MADCTLFPTYTFYVSYTVWFADITQYNFALGFFNTDKTIFAPPASVSASLNVPMFNGASSSAPGPAGWNNGGTSGMYLDNFGLVNWFDLNGVIPDQYDPHHTLLSIFQPSVFIPCYEFSPNYVFSNKYAMWIGHIQLMQQVPAIPPTTQAQLMPRRWITGFESEFGSEGVGFAGALTITRDASRTVNGLGGALRSATNSNFVRATNVYQTSLTPVSSWERFYIRVRNFDALPFDIWKCESFPSPSSGIRVYLISDGSLSIYNVNSSNVETLLVNTTVIFLQDIFVKLDLLINYNSNVAGGQGRFRLYADGILIVDEFVVAASGGIGQNSTYHLQSRLGTQLSPANVWEVDFDDWICSDIPTVSGTEALTSLDWLSGLHVKLVRVLSSTITNWTGQTESLNQMMSPINVSSGSRLTSSTALAQITGITELQEGNNADFSGYSVAPLSAVIAKYGTRVTNNGKLGYSISGGSNVLSTITESASPQYNTVLYLSGGTQNPIILSPFNIVHQKGNGSDLATVYALAASVEYLGIWGIEDNASDTQMPNEKYLIHNGAYYSNSPWNGFFISQGVVCIHSGLYTGNGTVQNIEVGNVPFHFLFVRPLTGGTKNGFRWFATGLTGHFDSQDGTDPECPVHVYWDLNSLSSKFTVVGTNADSNANGVVYQWIAFCDPTTRYNICGAFLHSTATTSAVNNLFNTGFTPNAIFTQNENSIVASTNIKLAYKGVGNTTNQGVRVDGNILSTYMTFGTGTLTSRTNSHLGSQTTYSAWRTDDGNTTPDVFVQITSYTGDGTASRDITLTPTSGRFPLLAIVIPHSGGSAVFRDPSHTSVNSGQLNGSSNILTASIIGGGIDRITIGTDINTIGVIYEVFAFPGSSTVGWIQANYCTSKPPPPTLRPPIPPPTVGPPPTPTPIPNIAIQGNGGLVLGPVTNATTLLVDVSGIYRLVPDNYCDLLFDKGPGVIIDFPIDSPVKSGYIGG